MRNTWMTRLMKPCVVARSLSLPPVSLSYEDLRIGHPRKSQQHLMPNILARAGSITSHSKRQWWAHAGWASTHDEARSSKLGTQLSLSAEGLDLRSLQMTDNHFSSPTSTVMPIRALGLPGTAPTALRSPCVQSGAFKTQATSRVRLRPCNNMRPVPPTSLASITAGYGEVGSDSKPGTTTRSHLRLQEHEEVEEDDPQIKRCKMTTTQKRPRN